MHIRKNDTVLIVRGRYKGRKGRVLEVYPQKERLLVEGVNMMKRHTKPSSRNQSGGIVERESSIHVSNVSAWCPEEKKPSKIVMKRLEDGNRVRTWQINGETID